MTIDILRHTFTVFDYAQMLTTGILREDDFVELIDGEVRQMSPIGPYHASVVAPLNRLLIRQVPDQVIIRVQDPVQLSDYSQPQPDIAIVVDRDDFYAHAHPTPEDIYILMEISDTSLVYDRTEKLPRYAQADIQEVWIIDTTAQHIEQYWQPTGNQYRTKQTWVRGEVIHTRALPGLSFDVDAIFG